MITSFPWTQPAVAQLAAARAQGRSPPALLIHEAPGTGGMELALYAARLRLCETGRACGRCGSCQRVARREHPDLFIVEPDADSKLGQITVEQVRQLAEQLALSSYEGRGSCAILYPAHAMNRNAANALLKTLEEPRADAQLILVTTSPSLLPATVRSRCQKIRLSAPSREAVLAWLTERKPAHRAQWPAVLEVVGNSPLEALEADVPRLLALRADVLAVLGQARQGRIDVIRVAEGWAREDLPLRLSCIENCLTERLLAMRAGTRLQDGDFDINIGHALRILDDVRVLQSQLSTSLNKPLALERHLWLLNGAGVA